MKLKQDIDITNKRLRIKDEKDNFYIKNDFNL